MKLKSLLILMMSLGIYAQAQLQITQCANDSSMAAGANCQVVLPDFTGQVIAEDIMFPGTTYSVTQDPIPGTIIDSETTMVTFTANDGIGGTVSCQMTFTKTTNPMFCEVTYVPDDNFEQWLIDNNYDSGVPDDYVLTANISTITILPAGSGGLENKGITDLTGIEDFVSLTQLSCSQNALTSIDLSTNTQLEFLHLNNNQITNLDLGNNTALVSLNVSNNLLTNMNLSSNTVIETVNVGNNQLSSLNLNSNTLLKTLQVYGNQFSSLNLDNNTSLENLQVNGNQFGSLNVTLNTSLTSLNCSNNQLTSLNLSTNTALEYLECDNNQLTGIDLDDNILLEELYCQFNDITSLNVGNNPILAYLYSNDNELTSLDLSANPLMEELQAQNNQLIALNVKNGSNASNFSVVNAQNNPNLSCIEVDDAVAATSGTGNYGGWVKDVTSIYANNCKIHVPDDNFEQALIDLMLDDVLDDEVATANINAITTLSLGYKGILDFTGIEGFEALVDLNIQGNAHTSIDVSMLQNLKELRTHSNGDLTTINITGAIALEYLRFNNTGVTNVDMSTNVNLKQLWAFSLPDLVSPLDIGNNLLLEWLLIQNSSYSAALDLSQHTALTYVNLSNNNIATLDLRNGLNTAITFFEAINMSTLSCISVDNAIDANAGANNYANWTKDATINYGNDCGTYVPDDNFEQALIDLNLDSGVLDDYVPTVNISGITTLNVSNKGIVDLTGIEGFISLESLFINDNNIASLNISTIASLKTLRTTRNAIVNLDLSNQTQLEVLIADNNGTESLMLNSPNVKYLQVGQNNLDTMDLSLFPLLEQLFVYGNDLTMLDVSANPSLKRIESQHNMLSGLDLSMLSNLEAVKVFNNELTSLNVKNGNNALINDFQAQNNFLLNCILVDDAAYSATNWTSIDVTSNFNDVTCGISTAFKVYLQGAFLNPNVGEEALMRDDLRTQGLIPLTSPYGDDGTTTQDVLNVVGSQAVVDWIQVEFVFFEDAPSQSIMPVQGDTTTISALLLRDGSIVDKNGVSLLRPNIADGSYNLNIKHRNHLGVRYTFTQYLSEGNALTLDFTDANNQITYGTDAQTTFGMPSGVVAMWAGDSDGDGRLSYSGALSDVPTIRSQVFNDPNNSVFGGPPVGSYPSQGYNGTDVNMDGVSVYSGASSDVLIIRNNIFNNPSNSVFGGPPTSTFVFTQQLPGGAN